MMMKKQQPKANLRHGNITLRTLTLLLGLALFALGMAGNHAYAGAVDSSVARAFACNWLAKDATPFGLDAGNRTVSDQVQAVTNADGRVVAYIVSFQEGGYLAIAADDRINPVVFVAASGAFDPNPQNPLNALLVADLTARLAEADEIAPEGAAVRGEIPDNIQENKNVWSQFTGAATRAAGSNISYISEIWVDRLISTNWGQLTENDSNGNPQAVYNYYTPWIGEANWKWDDGNAGNISTGCTATGTAQIVNYFRWPRGSVANSKGKLNIYYYRESAGTDKVDPAYFRGGNGQGSPYNWDLMVDSPTGSSPVEVRQAIGALMTDAGRSVTMNHNSDRGGSSSAGYTTAAFTGADKFMFGGAKSGGNFDFARANLDAGRPLAINISGIFGSGHAIVMDGYGRMGNRWYWHFNFGWGAAANSWYCLDDNYMRAEYTAPSSVAVGNIYRCAQQKNEVIDGGIISGRVTDGAGNPIAGVKVHINKKGESEPYQYMLAWYDPIKDGVDKYSGEAVEGLNDGDTQKYRNCTDANGIFAIDKVAAGNYTIVLEKDGLKFEGDHAVDGLTSAKNSWGHNFVAVADDALALDSWYLEGGNVVLVFNHEVGSVNFDLSKMYVGTTQLDNDGYVVNASANQKSIVVKKADGTAISSGNLTLETGFAYYDLNGVDAVKTNSNINTGINIVKIDTVKADDQTADAPAAAAVVTGIARCDESGNPIAEEIGNVSELFFLVSGADLSQLKAEYFTVYTQDAVKSTSTGLSSTKDGGALPESLAASMVEWDSATGIATVNATKGEGYVRLDYQPQDETPYLAGERYYVDIFGPSIYKTVLESNNKVVTYWTEAVEEVSAEDFYLIYNANGGAQATPRIAGVASAGNQVTFTIEYPEDGTVVEAMTGVEKIEIRAYDGAVSDEYGNEAPRGVTTGKMLLFAQDAITATGYASYDNRSYQLVFNKRIFGNYSTDYGNMSPKKVANEIPPYPYKGAFSSSNIKSAVVNYKDGSTANMAVNGFSFYQELHTNYVKIDVSSTSNQRLVDPWVLEEEGKEVKDIIITLKNISDWDDPSKTQEVVVKISLNGLFKPGKGGVTPVMFTNDEDCLYYIGAEVETEEGEKKPYDKPKDWGQRLSGQSTKLYGMWYRDLDGDGRVDAVDMKFLCPTYNPESATMELTNVNVNAENFCVFVQNNDPLDLHYTDEAQSNIFGSWNKDYNWLKGIGNDNPTLAKEWRKVNVNSIEVVAADVDEPAFLRLHLDQNEIIPMTYGDRLVMVSYNRPDYMTKDENPEPQGIFWRWVFSPDSSDLGYYFVDGFMYAFALDGAAPVGVSAVSWRATPFGNGNKNNDGYEYVDITMSEPIAFANDWGVTSTNDSVFGWERVASVTEDGPINGAWGAEVIGEDSRTVRMKYRSDCRKNDRSFHFYGAMYPVHGNFDRFMSKRGSGESAIGRCYDWFYLSGTSIGIRPNLDGRYAVLGQDDNIESVILDIDDANIQNFGYIEDSGMKQSQFGLDAMTANMVAQGGAYMPSIFKWQVGGQTLVASGRDEIKFDTPLSSSTTLNVLLNEKKAGIPGSGVLSQVSKLITLNTTMAAYNMQCSETYGVKKYIENDAPNPFEVNRRCRSTELTPKFGVMAGPYYSIVKASATQLSGSQFRLKAGQSVDAVGINVGAPSSYKLTAVKVRLLDVSKGQFDPAVDLLPLADNGKSGVELIDVATGESITASYDGNDWSDWQKNAAGLLYREVTIRPIGGVVVPTAAGEPFSFDYYVRLNTSENFNLGDNFIVEIPDDGILFGADYATVDGVADTWGTSNGAVGYQFNNSLYYEVNMDGIWQRFESFLDYDDYAYKAPIYDGGYPCSNKYNWNTSVNPGDNVYSMFYAKKDGGSYWDSNHASWIGDDYNPMKKLTKTEGIGDLMVNYMPGDDVWYEIGGTYGVYDEGIDIPVMGNADGFALPYTVEEAGTKSTMISGVASCTAQDVAPQSIAAPSGTPVQVLAVNVKDSGRGFAPRYILNGAILVETISKNVPSGNYQNASGLSFDGTGLSWYNGEAVDVASMKIGDLQILKGDKDTFVVIRKLQDIEAEAQNIPVTVSNEDDRGIQQPSKITGVRILAVGAGNAADESRELKRTGTQLSWNGGANVDVKAGGTFVLNEGQTDYLVVEVTSVGGATSELLAVYTADGRDVMPFLNVSGLEIMAVSDMYKQGYYTFTYNGGSVSCGGGNPVALNNTVGGYTIVHGDTDGAYLVVKRTGAALPSSKAEDVIFVNQLQLLQKVYVELVSKYGVTASHFNPMSQDATSGISLWADNDGDGTFSTNDTLVKLLETPVLTGSGTIYSCTFTLDPSDISAWISGTEDHNNFFICVNTTVDMSYGDQFYVKGNFYESNSELKNGLLVASATSKTITATSVTNTILQKQTTYGQLVNAGDRVSMIGIDHFLERDMGSAVRLTDLAFTIQDETKYEGSAVAHMFDIETCLTELDVDNQRIVSDAERGIAIFVDTNGNGVLDSADTAVRYNLNNVPVINEENGSRSWDISLTLLANDLLNVPTSATVGKPEVFIVLNMAEDLPYGLSFRMKMASDGCKYTTGQGSASQSIMTDVLSTTLDSAIQECMVVENIVGLDGLTVVSCGSEVANGYHTISVSYDAASNQYYLNWGEYSVLVDMTTKGQYTLGTGNDSINLLFDPSSWYTEDVYVGGCESGRPDGIEIGTKLTRIDGETAYWDKDGDKTQGADEPVFYDTDNVYTLPWFSKLLDTDGYESSACGEDYREVTSLYDAAEISVAGGEEVEAGKYLYFIDITADGKGYDYLEDVIVVRTVAADGTMGKLTYGDSDKIVLNPQNSAIAKGMALQQFQSYDYVKYSDSNLGKGIYDLGSHLYLAYGEVLTQPTAQWQFRVDTARHFRAYDADDKERFGIDNAARMAVRDIIGLDLCNSDVEGITFNSVKLTFTPVANGDYQFIPDKTLMPLAADMTSGVQIWRDANGDGIFNPFEDEFVTLKGSPIWVKTSTGYEVSLSLADNNVITSPKVDGYYDYFIVVMGSKKGNNGSAVNEGDKFKVSIGKGNVVLSANLAKIDAVSTGTIVLDTKNPELIDDDHVVGEDTNGDGLVDKITLAFDEQLSREFMGTGFWVIKEYESAAAEPEYTVTEATLDESGTTVELKLASNLTSSCGVLQLNVDYAAAPAQGIMDWSYNPWILGKEGVKVYSNAAPQIANVTGLDSDKDGSIDLLKVVFTTDVDVTTICSDGTVDPKAASKIPAVKWFVSSSCDCTVPLTAYATYAGDSSDKKVDDKIYFTFDEEWANLGTGIEYLDIKVDAGETLADEIGNVLNDGDTIPFGSLKEGAIIDAAAPIMIGAASSQRLEPEGDKYKLPSGTTWALTFSEPLIGSEEELRDNLSDFIVVDVIEKNLTALLDANDVVESLTESGYYTIAITFNSDKSFDSADKITIKCNGGDTKFKDKAGYSLLDSELPIVGIDTQPIEFLNPTENGKIVLLNEDGDVAVKVNYKNYKPQVSWSLALYKGQVSVVTTEEPLTTISGDKSDSNKLTDDVADLNMKELAVENQPAYTFILTIDEGTVNEVKQACQFWYVSEETKVNAEGLLFFNHIGYADYYDECLLLAGTSKFTLEPEEGFKWPFVKPELSELAAEVTYTINGVDNSWTKESGFAFGADNGTEFPDDAVTLANGDKVKVVLTLKYEDEEIARFTTEEYTVVETLPDYKKPEVTSVVITDASYKELTPVEGKYHWYDKDNLYGKLEGSDDLGILKYQYSVMPEDATEGGWEETGSASVERREFGYSKLSGRKVLVFGGYDKKSTDLASAEIYDLDDGQWEPADDMNVARSYMAYLGMTFGGKPYVYSFGGKNGSKYLDSIECYDVENDSWTLEETNKLPVPVYGAAAVRVNSNTVWVIGGRGKDGYKKTIQQITFDDDGKVTEAKLLDITLSVPRYCASAFAQRNKSGARVIVLGGNNYNDVKEAATDCFEYNASTGEGKQTEISGLPALVGFAALQVTDSKGNNTDVWVMGGQTYEGQTATLQNKTYKLTGASEVWEEGPEMNMARRKFAAAWLADSASILVGGGYAADVTNAEASNAEVTDTTEMMSYPDGKVWEEAQPYSLGSRDDHKMVALGGNGTVLTFGGTVEKAPTKTAEICSSLPEEPVWSKELACSGKTISVNIDVLDEDNFESKSDVPVLEYGNGYKLWVRLYDVGGNESDVVATLPVLIAATPEAKVTSEQIAEDGNTFYRWGVSFKVENVAQYQFSLDGSTWSETRNVDVAISQADLGYDNTPLTVGNYSFMVKGADVTGSWQAVPTDVAFQVVAPAYDNITIANTDVPEIKRGDSTMLTKASFQIAGNYGGIVSLNAKLEDGDANVQTYSDVVDGKVLCENLQASDAGLNQKLTVTSVKVKTGESTEEEIAITYPVEDETYCFQWTVTTGKVSFETPDENPYYTVETGSMQVTLVVDEVMYPYFRVNAGETYATASGKSFWTGELNVGTNAFKVEVSTDDVNWIEGNTLYVNVVGITFADGSDSASFGPTEETTLSIDMDLTGMDGLKYQLDDGEELTQSEATIVLNGLLPGTHTLQVWGMKDGYTQPADPAIATVMIIDPVGGIGSWMTADISCNDNYASAGSELEYNLVLSDKVMVDPVASDFTVKNGNITDITKVDDTHYTIKVTPALGSANDGYVKVSIDGNKLYRYTDGWGNQADSGDQVLAYDQPILTADLSAFLANADGEIADGAVATDKVVYGQYFVLDVDVTTATTLLGAGFKLNYDNNTFKLAGPLDNEGNLIAVEVLNSPYSDGEGAFAPVADCGDGWVEFTGVVLNAENAADCSEGFTYAKLLFQAIAENDGSAKNLWLSAGKAGISTQEYGVLIDAGDAIALGEMAMKVEAMTPVYTMSFASGEALEGVDNPLTITANYAATAETVLPLKSGLTAIIPAGVTSTTVTGYGALTDSANVLKGDFEFEEALADDDTVSAKFTVIENDTAAIAFAATSDAEGQQGITSVDEGGSFYLQFNLGSGVTAADDVAITLNYSGTAVFGTDYIQSAVLKVPAGASKGSVTISTNEVDGDRGIDINVTSIKVGDNEVSQLADDLAIAVTIKDTDTIPGDFVGGGSGQGDGVVDISDILYFVTYYDTTVEPDDPRYDSYLVWADKCDLNNDGIVDITDVLILVAYYNAPATRAAVRSNPSISFKITEKYGLTELNLGDTATIQIWVKSDDVVAGVVGASVNVNFDKMEYYGNLTREGNLIPSEIVSKDFTIPSGTLSDNYISKLGGSNTTYALAESYDNYILLAEFEMVATELGDAKISIDHLDGTVPGYNTTIGTLDAIAEVDELTLTVMNGTAVPNFTMGLEVEYDGAAVREDEVLELGMNPTGTGNIEGNAGAPRSYSLAFVEDKVEYVSLFEVATEDETIWKLSGKVVGDSGNNTDGTVTIDWSDSLAGTNSYSMPEFYDFVLVFNGRELDMRAIENCRYTFAPKSGIIDAAIKVKKHVEGECRKTLILTRGDNLIGIPFDLDDASKKKIMALEPMDVNWNAIESGDDLKAGNAYWIYVNAKMLPDASGSLTVTMTGTEVENYTGVSLKEGQWNAVTPVYQGSETFDNPLESNPEITKMWYWTRSGYKVVAPADSIVYGRGYLIYSTDNIVIWE